MSIRAFVTSAGAFLLLLFGSATQTHAQEWLEETPLPRALHSVVAVAADGAVYVAGGREGRSAVSNALLRYDVNSDAWQDDLPAMDKERYFAAAAVLNNKIYVIGGRDQEGEVLESVEVFDVRTQVWSEADNLEEGRFGHTAVVLDGSLYVLGGADDDGEVLESVEVYDAEEDEWSESESWQLDQPRTAFATVAVGRSAYSFGGINRVPLPQVQRFGFQDGSGVFIPPGLLEARAYTAAVAVGDSIYIIGGRNARNRVLDDVVLFIPSELPGRQWKQSRRLRTAREGFGAAEVDGTIYVIGGRDPDARTLSSMESFSASAVATEDPWETGFELEQNHPNPFTTSTKISFMVEADDHVLLEIFDVQGRLVERLVEGYLPPGRHDVAWDGQSGGRLVSSGVYFYRLRQGQSERVKMMTRIR